MEQILIPPIKNIRQHRTIPALRLKHRSGSCGTASALPKCSIMSGCGTRIVLRGQKPLALCDRCPCFGSLFPPLAALTFTASSIICAFGLASAAPRSPYRHLELCGIAKNLGPYFAFVSTGSKKPRQGRQRRTPPGQKVKIQEIRIQRIALGAGSFSAGSGSTRPECCQRPKQRSTSGRW